LGEIISLRIFTFDLKQCSAAAIEDMNYKQDIFDYEEGDEYIVAKFVRPSILNVFLKVT